MNSITHNIWIAICLALCTQLSSADVSAESPGVEVETVPGTVKEEIPVLREHEDFTHVFTVTNPFERAIRVQKIDTSCTCLKTELGKYFLIPEESTTLGVVVSNERSSGLKKYKMWLYVTDPELEAIEINTQWEVLPDIAVDLITSDPKQRPENHQYRDIYRYTNHVRPDEAHRLKKYIRLSTPDTLEGGLQVTPTYAGKIWDFSVKVLDEKSVLLIAKALTPDAELEAGLFQEIVTLKTNHPHKAEFSLQFFTNVDSAAEDDAAVDGENDVEADPIGE